MIFEKAFAKWASGYENLAGHCQNVAVPIGSERAAGALIPGPHACFYMDKLNAITGEKGVDFATLQATPILSLSASFFFPLSLSLSFLLFSIFLPHHLVAGLGDAKPR